MSSWAAAESAVKARNSEEAANLRISKEKILIREKRVEGLLVSVLGSLMAAQTSADRQ